jgi:hypothetical protein
MKPFSFLVVEALLLQNSEFPSIIRWLGNGLEVLWYQGKSVLPSLFSYVSHPNPSAVSKALIPFSSFKLVDDA